MHKLLLAIALIGMLLVGIGLILLVYQLSPLGQPTAPEYPSFKYPAVHILSNGTVEPASAPINSDGNYYTLKADLEAERLFVERSNIILDGNGFSLSSPVLVASKGGPVYGNTYVTVLNGENVTLRNLRHIHMAFLTIENSSTCRVTNSNISITVNNSHDIIISTITAHYIELINSRSCTISSCNLGRVNLKDAQYNMILNNKMTEYDWLALRVEDSNSNLFFGNSVEQRYIKLFEIKGSSGSNLFVGNYIRGTYSFADAKDLPPQSRLDPILNCDGVNTFYHNNFVYVYWNKTVTNDTPNLWDNGFEGNYWNDYQGEDVNGDGIGDTPHLVDDNNQDRYPLMNPLDLNKEPMPKFP